MADKNKTEMSKDTGSTGNGTRVVKTPITMALIIIYMVLVLLSGYWYWSRPVRADQFNNAYRWWIGIADVYEFPVPEDERWQ